MIKSHTRQVGDSPNQKIIITTQKFSRRSESSEPHIRIPSLGVWHQEEEPLEHLALKASRACSQEIYRTGGNKLRSWRVHDVHWDPGEKAVTS